jgi:hypothetical protein
MNLTLHHLLMADSVSAIAKNKAQQMPTGIRTFVTKSSALLKHVGNIPIQPEDAELISLEKNAVARRKASWAKAP